MRKIEKAWQEYNEVLLRFIHSKINSPEEAEDILSHVFSKLLMTAKNKDIPENISSWLYRVSRNSIIDYYRTRKNFTELPLHLTDEVEESDILQELEQCLLPMINELPEKYRSTIILSEIKEKKHKEIAAELGVSLSATKSRVLRGRKMLHNSFLECCNFEENQKGNISGYEKKTKDSCNYC